MKSIVVVNNSSKKISYLLNNLMDYTIDKEDHVLRLHRIVDGDDLFDNIQLKDNTFDRLPIDFSRYIVPFCEIVDRRMQEFLADDDEDILDISEYVNQYAMMRDDEEEDTRDDCTGYFSTRHFCPHFHDGKCNYIGECYWKGQRPS